MYEEILDGVSMEFIPMGADELVRKILSGERDLRRIQLTGSKEISQESIRELNAYFKGNDNDLRENPLNLIRADLSHLVAKHLCPSYVRAEYANFDHAELRGSIFVSSGLFNAEFAYADLSNAEFRDTHLVEANFYLANLCNACMYETDVKLANFNEAILSYADLRGAKNLDRSFLNDAYFKQTTIRRQDRKAVQRILNNRQFIIYRGPFEEE